MIELTRNFIMGNIPGANNEETNQLLIAEGKRDELITGNMALAAHLSKSYSKLGVPLEDTLQNCFVALIGAVDTYKAGKGTLSSWITTCIRTNVWRDVMSDMDRKGFEIPEAMSRQYRKILKVYPIIEAQGKKPTPDLIAFHTEIKEERVKEVIRTMAGNHFSGDRVDVDTQTTFFDITPDIGSQIDAASNVHDTNMALAFMTAKQKGAIKEVYGLDGRPAKTAGQLGKVMGASTQAIQSLCKQGIKNAQKNML